MKKWLIGYRLQTPGLEQDPVFRSQVLVLKEQFLVNQTRHVRQQAQPLVVLHAERP